MHGRCLSTKVFVRTYGIVVVYMICAVLMCILYFYITIYTYIYIYIHIHTHTHIYTHIHYMCSLELCKKHMSRAELNPYPDSAPTSFEKTTIETSFLNFRHRVLNFSPTSFEKTTIEFETFGIEKTTIECYRIHTCRIMHAR